MLLTDASGRAPAYEKPRPYTPTIKLCYAKGPDGKKCAGSKVKLMPECGTHAWFEIDGYSFGFWPDADDMYPYEITHPDPYENRAKTCCMIPKKGNEKGLRKLQELVLDDWSWSAEVKWNLMSYSCIGWMVDLMKTSGLLAWPHHLLLGIAGTVPSDVGVLCRWVGGTMRDYPPRK